MRVLDNLENYDIPSGFHLTAEQEEQLAADLKDWTDKQETRAVINILIRDTLWSELPASYDEASVDHYRQEIYEYVYTRYRYVA